MHSDGPGDESDRDLRHGDLLMAEQNVTKASNEYDNPATQAQYNQDKAKDINADVDKNQAQDELEQEKMLAKIAERMNHELMDMILENKSCMDFIRNYLKAAWDFADRNGLEWWEVGIDGSQSWFHHDGKTVMFKFCRVAKSVNPITGEEKTQSGIVLPKRGL